MSSTFSNLKFELIGNGEQSGQWGTTTNANIGTAIEQAIVGMATLDSGDFTANVCTLTLSNTNAAQDARALCLNIAAGAVSAAGTINVPAIQKPYIVINGSSFAVTVKVSGQTGVAVPAGTRTVVYNNGTDVGTQLNWLNSLTLNNALPITSGGTGTSSTTFVDLAINVTGTLPVANGGTGATTASGARSALSAQETLVSGTNIKTINSTSLLGSGNIAVVTAPAGSNTQVQFNNAGAFGASSGFTFNSSSNRIGLGSFNAGLLNNDSTNVAVGVAVGGGVSTGQGNILFGSLVLPYNDVSNCVGFGKDVLTYAAGSGNTAIGNQVLQGSFPLPNNGVENVGIGYQVALGGGVSGSYNVFMGSGVGQNAAGASYNTYIGYQAGRFPSTTATGTNNTALGNGATPASATVSNTITLGNSSIATLRCQVTTITSLSDRRDKTNLSSIGDALNLIRNIVPVRFVWNMRDGGKVGEADTGFIAQQLLEAQQVSDMHIPGLVDETNPDKLEAGYGKLIPVLVKALQQLDAEFQAYKLAHP
jgi:hypothetical protein